MAGGLFPGYPFKLNIKCIIFTAFLAGGYWYLPPKNLYVLIFLLWFPYIALAWYDYMYKCSPAISPTLVPFGQYAWLPFKPPTYKKEFAEDLNLQKSYRSLDHIIAWSIIIGIIGWMLLKK